MLNIALAMIAFSCCYFLDDSWGSTKVWAMMIVRFFLFNCGFVKWVNIHEINPTPARSAGFAMSMMCSRIAGMMAPFLKDLGDRTHHSVPFIVFMTLSSLSIASVYMLPETLHKRLPDTIEDVQLLRRQLIPKHSKKGKPIMVTQNNN